jgi:hypothetical protein
VLRPPVFEGDDAAIAAPAPAPVPRGCTTYRDVIAAVNRANALYARALRTLDESILHAAWADQAYWDVAGQVENLRAWGSYATPRLFSITLHEVSLRGNTATVRTIEHWLYQERSRWGGGVLYEQDQWVQNVYTLNLRGGSWLVVRDVITVVDGPPPPAPHALARITSDRGEYGVGESAKVTISNLGTVQLTAGLAGYACTPVGLERLTGGTWEPQSLPTFVACPAIALIFNPGESRNYDVPAGSQPGFYRFVFRYSSELGNGVVYSDPYIVR